MVATVYFGWHFVVDDVARASLLAAAGRCCWAGSRSTPGRREVRDAPLEAAACLPANGYGRISHRPVQTEGAST